MYKNAISYIIHKIYVANNPLSEKRSGKDKYLVVQLKNSLQEGVKYHPPYIYNYDIANTIDLLFECDQYLDVHIKYSIHLYPENITELSGVYKYNHINPNLMDILASVAEYMTTQVLSNSNKLTSKIIDMWFDKSNGRIIELIDFIKKSCIWNNNNKSLMIIDNGTKRKLKDIYAREIFYIYKIKKRINGSYYNIDTSHTLKNRYTNLKYNSGRYKIHNDIPSIEEFVTRNSKLIRLIESTINNIFNEYKNQNAIINKLIKEFTVKIMPAVSVFDKEDTRIWIHICISLANIFRQLCKNILHSELDVSNYISFELNFAIKL